MDAEAAQSFVIALQDGTELHIGAKGARIGARLYELARIQDARQVSPEPETLALRVAGGGVGGVCPARRGGGRAALEASCPPVQRVPRPPIGPRQPRYDRD